MPTINFGGLDSNDDVEEQLAEVQKVLTWLLNGRLDTLNIRELTADKIDTGVLNAMLVVIKAVSGGKFFQLNEDGIVANNGTVDTLNFDLATGLLTIVSALIQSATGYPKVELNSQDNLIGAYQSLGNAIRIIPTYGGSTPALMFDIGGATKATAQLDSAKLTLATLAATNIRLQSAGDLELSTLGNITVNGDSGWTGNFPIITSVDFEHQDIDISTVYVKKGLITGIF